MGTALKAFVLSHRLQQMLHKGFAFDVTPHLRLDVAIATRETLVLAQVLGPRRHQKGFEKHVGVLEIPKDAPPPGAIPSSDSAIGLHRLHERVFMSLSDVVSHRHQHGLTFGRRRNTLHERRQPPVVPWCGGERAGRGEDATVSGVRVRWTLEFSRNDGTH